MTGIGNFEVMISLYRDPELSRQIMADFGALVKLAEGQIIYVSVDLKKSYMVQDDDVSLVMNSCFVTSSLNENQDESEKQKPMLHLLRDR